MFRQGSSPHEICSFISSKLSQAGLSQKLTIIDPYALAYDIDNPGKNLHNPTTILTDILEPHRGKFHSLEFVIGAKSTKKSTKNHPKQHIDNLKNSLNIDVKYIRAPAFHDRFWIVDDRLAFIVGTSLTSFGNKHFFIQNSFLDRDDTELLLNLYRNGVNNQ